MVWEDENRCRCGLSPVIFHMSFSISQFPFISTDGVLGIQAAKHFPSPRRAVARIVC